MPNSLLPVIQERTIRRLGRDGFTQSIGETPKSFPSRCELPAELRSARQPRQLSPRGSWRGSRPPHRLMLSGKIADLVEVADVNWNRNIGGVAVVEEMLEVDLDGNGTNEFAEAGHLEIFHVPDFEHEGAEVFADKGHPAIIQIYCVKVRVGEGRAAGLPEGRRCRRGARRRRGLPR